MRNCIKRIVACISAQLAGQFGQDSSDPAPSGNRSGGTVPSMNLFESELLALCWVSSTRTCWTNSPYLHYNMNLLSTATGRLALKGENEHTVCTTR